MKRMRRRKEEKGRRKEKRVRRMKRKSLLCDSLLRRKENNLSNILFRCNQGVNFQHAGSSQESLRATVLFRKGNCNKQNGQLHD